MKNLLEVYPYDVEITLPDDVTDFQSAEYTEKAKDALLWLASMQLDMGKHWKLTHIDGRSPTVFGFKRAKDAMLFKVVFG